MSLKIRLRRSIVIITELLGIKIALSSNLKRNIQKKSKKSTMSTETLFQKLNKTMLLKRRKFKMNILRRFKGEMKRRPRLPKNIFKSCRMNRKNLRQSYAHSWKNLRQSWRSSRKNLRQSWKRCKESTSKHGKLIFKNKKNMLLKPEENLKNKLRNMQVCFNNYKLNGRRNSESKLKSIRNKTIKESKSMLMPSVTSRTRWNRCEWIKTKKSNKSQTQWKICARLCKMKLICKRIL